MAPATSLVNKIKVQLKLAISRLRMTQQKDTAIAKQQRRAMAQLLEEKKLESARIRVENIIRSDITTELHEMLELYCELLIARAQLLDAGSTTSSLSLRGTASKATDLDTPLDPGLEEAVRSIIYAAPRTEIKELHQARALLIEKFGKDFALSAMDGEGVAERVLKKLKVETPARELVDQYLRLIAETYNVKFPGDPDPVEEDEEDDDEGSDGGLTEPPLEAPLETGEVVPTTPRGDVGNHGKGTPIKIAPASPSTENVSNKLKLPDKTSVPKPRKQSAGDAGSKKMTEARKAVKDGDGPGGKIPDLGDLAARFAALKKG